MNTGVRIVNIVVGIINIGFGIRNTGVGIVNIGVGIRNIGVGIVNIGVQNLKIFVLMWNSCVSIEGLPSLCISPLRGGGRKAWEEIFLAH